jgi:hypothetical protein
VLSPRGQESPLLAGALRHWPAPGLVEALRTVPVRSCTIDGELVADEDDRAGDIWTLHRALRERRDEQICIVGFDLLHLDGRDLRVLPWTERKARLDGLTARARLEQLLMVEHFNDGNAAPNLRALTAAFFDSIDPGCVKTTSQLRFRSQIAGGRDGAVRGGRGSGAGDAVAGVPR